ncbi:MAG: carbohydrate ABC transporter permease [Chloroflexi bacterium]|nr:carbohydrate ABC transporter permease [Chloroflexota bacterium]
MSDVAPSIAAPRTRSGSAPATLQREKLLKNVLRTVVLVITLAIVIFPLYWMLVTAFDPPTLGYNAKITLYPTKVTLAAFAQLLREYPFTLWMWNSLWVALTSTLCAVVIGTLAAYSLSRLRYPGRGILSAGFFLAYLFPGTLLIVPIFVILSTLGLTDSYLGLVASYMIFTVPFCTWMLKAYLAGIPRELEEAGLVDGATRLQAMTRIILPLAAPGVAAATIFAFTLAWNEYLYAFILMTDSSKMTLSPGMTKLVFGDIFLWGMIMSAATLMSLPVLVLYFIAQRFVVSGLTAGSVKG